MYAGEVVETGERARHLPPRPPSLYQASCWNATRRAWRSVRRRHLPTIPGDLPDLVALPTGCVFADRCPEVFEPCRHAPPEFYALAGGRASRCYLCRAEAMA
jgi:peptide/nickel transport system ATP-binding protein